jgi:proline racemase
VHPTEPDLSGLYGTIITDAPSAPDRDGRNVTIYAEGAVDRSPCGTGTSARLAQLHARGRLGVAQPYVHESLIGTTFTGTIVGQTEFASLPAVDTEIAGRGFLTGLHQFVVDPDDPTAAGFLPR